MAVFAHDYDIDYSQIMEQDDHCKVIKLFDDCNSIDKVDALQKAYPEIIPKIIKNPDRCISEDIKNEKKNHSKMKSYIEEGNDIDEEDDQGDGDSDEFGSHMGTQTNPIFFYSFSGNYDPKMKDGDYVFFDQNHYCGGQSARVVCWVKFYPE